MESEDYDAWLVRLKKSLESDIIFIHWSIWAVNMYCGRIIVAYLCHNGSGTTKTSSFLGAPPLRCRKKKSTCGACFRMQEEDQSRIMIILYGHYYIFIYVFCLHDCVCTIVFLQRSEDNLCKSILSFYHVGPCDELRSSDLASQALLPTRPSI